MRSNVKSPLFVFMGFNQKLELVEIQILGNDSLPPLTKVFARLIRIPFTIVEHGNSLFRDRYSPGIVLVTLKSLTIAYRVAYLE